MVLKWAVLEIFLNIVLLESLFSSERTFTEPDRFVSTDVEFCSHDGCMVIWIKFVDAILFLLPLLDFRHHLYGADLP